jgi:hypothetical protein
MRPVSVFANGPEARSSTPVERIWAEPARHRRLI